MVGSTPQIHVPIPTPAALVLASGRCCPWPCCSRSISGKSQTNPTLRFESAGERVHQARAEAGDLPSPRHSGPCGHAAQMAILKRQRGVASRPPLTSKRCVDCAREHARGCAEVMAGDHAQRKPCPRPTAWEFHAPKRRGRVQGRGGQAATQPSLKRQFEAPEVRASSRAARGAPLPSSSLQGGAATGGDVAFFPPNFFSPPHPPSRRPPRSHHRRGSCSSPRAAQLGEGCGPHRWCRRRILSNSNTAHRPVPDHVLQSARPPGMPGVKSGRCRGPSSRRGSRPRADGGVLAVGEKASASTTSLQQEAAPLGLGLGPRAPWPSRACRFNQAFCPARPRAL